MNSSRLMSTSVVRGGLLPLALFSLVTFQAVAFADTSYGPVRSGETLSSIVNENYILSPFSDQVIMQEIFRNNTGAFIANNIGLLKQGVTLKLPSDQSLLSASSQISSTPTTARTTATQAAPTQSQNSQTINTLQQRLASVRAERDRTNRKLNQIESESKELKSRVAELESTNFRLNAEIKAADESLQLARSELTKVKEASKADLEAAKLQANNSVTSTQADQSTLVAEKDQRIKALETSIAKLQDDQASELLALKTTLGTKGGEQEALEAKVATLAESAEKLEEQIDQLKVKNESLVIELAESKTAYDQLLNNPAASQEVTTKDSLEAGNVDVGTSITADINVQTSSEPFDITTLNAQNISTQLEKSVTFPLWGALLAGLALALTTLLMFLARGRAKKAATVTPILFDDEPVVADDVVFRAADPERIEPDIEALRVPPRRDPSRVAILDPTMSDQVGMTTESANEVDTTEVGGDDSTEADLKLAMAEAYGELGDVQAASELLIEVQTEGSQKQSASAQILLNRLAG